MNKLRATSRTIVAFEGYDQRYEKDPHKYVATDGDDDGEEPDEFVFANPKYEHAHCSQWFSELNVANGLVDQAVRTDILPDRHTEISHYLYADGHVDVIAAAQIDEWIEAEFNFAQPEM